MAVNAAAAWIPIGLAFGMALGAGFGDVVYGVAIGLIGGSIVALGIERKQQKQKNLLLLVVAVIALVWMIALRAIEHA